MLITFRISFIWGWRAVKKEGFSFILLHVVLWFYQWHLLKGFPFFSESSWNLVEKSLDHVCEVLFLVFLGISMFQNKPEIQNVTCNGIFKGNSVDKTTESKTLPNKESNMRANVSATEYSSSLLVLCQGHIWMGACVLARNALCGAFSETHFCGKASVWKAEYLAGFY